MCLTCIEPGSRLLLIRKYWSEKKEKFHLVSGTPVAQQHTIYLLKRVLYYKQTKTLLIDTIQPKVESEIM